MANLDEHIENWWKNKAGRNLEDYMRFHKSIISKNVPEEDYNDFFNALDNNKFDISKTKKLIPIKNIFVNTELDNFVSSKYISENLKVTVKQPSNGAGEFLLVANYKNIKFGSSCDLLIDNIRTEIKGVKAKLGDFQAKFKQMDSSLEFIINKHFNERWDIKNFNSDIMKTILNKVFSKTDRSEDIKFLGDALQNTKTYDKNITSGFIKLFNKYIKTIDDIDVFKRCICSIHLYNYCKTKNCGYIIFVNDRDMILFKSPRSADEYYNITNYLNIGSWENGRGGITVTLQ